MVQPKKSVSKLSPYVNGQHTRSILENHTKIMKLDSNESTVSPSPRVMAALVGFIQNTPLNWYPDVDSEELVEKLSAYTQRPKNFIQTFNGSDNALETICRTFIEPEDEVILCMPTYDHFRVYAESCDAKMVPVSSDSPFTTCVSNIIEAVTDKTKIIYIVNPNSPTGVLYTENEIKEILLHAKHALVVVDEAYYEFCGQTLASLTEKFENLIITRSFSKAFALAGLRCGYIVTHPNNLEPINRVRVGKNINSLAQVAACAALDDREYMDRYVAEIKAAKSWLVGKLQKMGLNVVDTSANYILVEVEHPQKVQAYLDERKVYIRDRSLFSQLKGFVRITIGHHLLMERFWKVFSKMPSTYLFSLKNLSEKQSVL